VTADPVWTTACPDWEKRIVNRQSLIPHPPLFPKQAEAALRVMDQLRIVDQPGSPTWGELSRPWLRDFVASVFGAYDEESGRRLIREWMLLISKKNTKSTTAGLIMLTFLITNWRPAGEFGILAPTVEVANNAFKPAADAVKADDELKELFHVQDHIRTITHRVTKATLQVVAADSDTVAGKKWIVTLLDEIWLLGKRANAEDMLREATGGLLSRPEGCVLYLSTQSNEPPAGVFKQKLQYARGVRDGRIKDPQFCPVLYEFPDQMLAAKAYLKPENFYVTNPNLGASVDEPTLVRLLEQAKESGEESIRGTVAKHLNVEIGLSLRSDRWAGADFWEENAISLPIDDLLRRSEVVTAGVDGGGLDDLLGLVLIGRERDTRKWLVWAHAWAHEIVLTRRMEIAPRLRDFEKDGDLTIVQRPGQDVVEVANILCRVRDVGLLPEKNAIGVDRHGIGALISELESPGRDFQADQIQGIPQGYQLMGAIKDTERMLAGNDMLHGGRPLMNWCVGNARVEPKGNAILITKAISGSAKIDPLMALFDAAALMALNPEGLGASFWETERTTA
jgi:phage terminase large subunit-like protein